MIYDDMCTLPLRDMFAVSVSRGVEKKDASGETVGYRKRKSLKENKRKHCHRSWERQRGWCGERRRRSELQARGAALQAS